MLSGAKACKYCRSRQELSNEYLLAKFGVDTAENESIKVCLNFTQFCEVSTRASLSLSPFSSFAMLKTRGAIGAAGDVNIG